jgi:calcium-dependent protein kinase
MGLKQMFNNMDTDRSGTISVDELKEGLNKLGSNISEAEAQELMEAVRSHFGSVSAQV